MSIYAIGDCHGCLRALNALLHRVRPGAEDTVVFLGDYVDRGPDTRETIDRILTLSEGTKVIPLRGNHELMMMESRHDQLYTHSWLGFGGRATLESYDVDDLKAWEQYIPASHWEFFENTLPLYANETHIFVHASVAADRDLDRQSEAALYWRPCYSMDPHQSGRHVICGHTSQQNGRPLEMGHATCIDTWVYGSGWLTMLNVDTGEYYQANHRGIEQQGRLGNSGIEGFGD